MNAREDQSEWHRLTSNEKPLKTAEISIDLQHFISLSSLSLCCLRLLPVRSLWWWGGRRQTHINRSKSNKQAAAEWNDWNFKKRFSVYLMIFRLFVFASGGYRWWCDEFDVTNFLSEIYISSSSKCRSRLDFDSNEMRFRKKNTKKKAKLCIGARIVLVNLINTSSSIFEWNPLSNGAISIYTTRFPCKQIG